MPPFRPAANGIKLFEIVRQLRNSGYGRSTTLRNELLFSQSIAARPRLIIIGIVHDDIGVP